MQRFIELLRKGFKSGARGALAAALTVSALALAAVPASAATVTVNTVTDQSLGSCSSSCSLRDAVATANPGDIVQIPAGHYVLTLGDIISETSLTIVGAGARSTILDGNGASRIFEFTNPSQSVELDDVSLINGRAVTPELVFLNFYGGAIAGDANFTLRRCRLAGNQAELGGAIVWAGNLTIDQCTIEGNLATWKSGDFSGGGIAHTGGVFTMTNSTLTGNTASAGGGGGAVLVFSQVNMANVTVTANRAFSGGGLDLVVTGSIANSIIAFNAGGDCMGGGLVSDHSLDSDNSCSLTGPGDLPGVLALLGPLANNGGPTDTHALLAGSPALDAGNSATCLATDQRGVARPQGPVCDIGAYEKSAALPDCSHATASPNLLWPPNHKLVAIQISGVTNPGSGAVSITVTSIRQDEPVAGGPDGIGVGTSTPSVRSERDGGGDGRVYHIAFTATNSTGGSCTGAVTVGVPHDQGHNGGPVDQGALYDSTQP